MFEGWRYFLSVLPASICGVYKDKYNFWIDDKLVEVVKKELKVDVVDILISAGFCKKFKGRNFRKRDDVKMLADSGGFQFYFLTPGKQREFYEMREEMYYFQTRIGDYILAGDIPSGQELDEDQLLKYAKMTKDNIELQFNLGVQDTQFVNIIHGISPRSLNIWYDQVKGFPNIGWAIGAKASGALGFIFQMMFLLEKGELTEGKIVHMFALSGYKLCWQVMYALEALGLKGKIKLWSDSSSFSLGRFGSIFYEGDIRRYSDLRKKNSTLTMWDGSEISTDIPKALGEKESYDMNLTSIQHFLRWMSTDIFDRYENDKIQVNKVCKDVRKLIMYFKSGGTEAAWHYMKQNMSKMSKSRLTDKLYVQGAGGKKA